MKKKVTSFVLAILAGTLSVNAQVGINTPVPTSTFDINSKNTTGATDNVDGLLIPRVDRERAHSMKKIPTSTLIYINNITTGVQEDITINVDTVGYYYFNGTEWVKLNPDAVAPSSVNIYNSNGTLTSNRIVTQGSRTLAFTGDVTDAFSVDGSTFSVDAANNRIGMGTDTPTVKLDVQGSQFLNAAKDLSLTPNALDVNIGQDGFAFGNRGDNFGILMRTSSTVNTGPISRINFGDTNPGGSNSGNRYLSFSVGKNLNELMYLTDSNGAGVGIGNTNPNPSALVDITSTDKGFLVPRMTTAQRDAISNKAEGLMIYNLQVHCLQVWNATEWISTCGSGGSPTGTATISSCSGTPAGTYRQGIAMDSSNTLAITVNVTQTGPWVVSSATVNGVKWSGSGNFTALGSQNITLTASGTPTNTGSFPYTFTLGTSTCSRNITYVSGNGAGTILNCTSGTLAGNYFMGTAMNSSNTVQISVNATQTGPWTASSTSANGVTWSGSGNFTALGTQNITLTANGTPVSNGNFSYTFNLSGSTCTRTIRFLRTTPPGPNTTDCPGLGTTNFPGTYTIDGSSVSVSVVTSGTGTVATGIAQCAVNTTNHPWLIGKNGASTTTYTFSQPVSNVQFAITGLIPGEVVTITAKNGASNVSPTLTQIGGTCNGPVTMSGNKIITSDGSAIKVNGGGVYYTSITVQHNGAGQGGQMNIMLCNADTQ